MSNLKTIKIDDKLHSELKIYATKNSLKLNDWVEKIIKKEFDRIKNGTDR